MSNFRLSYLSCTILAGCTAMIPLSEPITIPAEFPLKDTGKSFVFIDAADVKTPGIAILKKREQVLDEVKKEFVQLLPAAIEAHLPVSVTVDTSLSELSIWKLLSDDSTVISELRRKHKADVIVVLKNCFGGFEQDNIDTEKKADGSKSKTAYYSVVFQSTWQILYKNMHVEKQVLARRPHSSRSVASGLLARGPGYQANKQDIMNMAKQNAYEFTGLFRDRQTTRITYSKKKK